MARPSDIFHYFGIGISSLAAELAKEKEKKVPVEEEENDKDGPIESIINDVVTTTSTSAYEELPSASVVPLPSEKRRRSTKNESEPKAKRSRVKPVDKVVVETADSSSDSESFPVPSRPVPQVVPPVISQVCHTAKSQRYANLLIFSAADCYADTNLPILPPRFISCDGQ